MTGSEIIPPQPPEAAPRGTEKGMAYRNDYSVTASLKSRLPLRTREPCL